MFGLPLKLIARAIEKEERARKRKDREPPASPEGGDELPDEKSGKGISGNGLTG
ncbi:MAG TPA: hypothetical protein PK636_09980 [bacterium]|nr:hypothetical protein [bacterium]HPJ73003.1 hypothetical protein [bacterium]HPQ66806.1 hypothetical protein [bacterium]